MAEDIGDTIGSNDTAIANTAYSLSSRIKELIEQKPYRRRNASPS
jgi:hypothetical protein